MPEYETRYLTPKGSWVSTQLWARGEDHARDLCGQRGMGEEFYGPYFAWSSASKLYLPSELIAKKRFADALHATMWLGMVATASKTRDGFSLLADGGIIHELCQVVTPAIREGYPINWLEGEHIRDNVLPQLLQLEEDTPGFTRYEPLVAREPMSTYEGLSAYAPEPTYQSAVSAADEALTRVRGQAKAYAAQYRRFDRVFERPTK